MKPHLRITLMALFAAWSAAFQLMPNLPGTYILKFNGFPIILSGFVLGPVGGFWTGALADILCFFIKPGGPYIPLFTLTSALTGWFPVWLYLHLPGARDHQGRLKLSPIRLLATIGFSQLATKVLLVTTFRAVLFSLPWEVLALRAALEQLVHAPLYAYVAWVVLRRVVLPSRRGSRASALDWASAADHDREPPFDRGEVGVSRTAPPE